MTVFTMTPAYDYSKVLVASTHKYSGAGSGAFTTDAINTTGANLLVIVRTSWDTMAAIDDPTDNKSNSWNKLTGLWSGAGFGYIQLFYSYDAIVGSDHTFSQEATTSIYPMFNVYAFSGMESGAGVYVKSNGGSIAYNRAITPSGSKEFIIDVLTSLDTSGVSVASPFTIQSQSYYSWPKVGTHVAFANPYNGLDTLDAAWTHAEDGGSAIFAFKYKNAGGISNDGCIARFSFESDLGAWYTELDPDTGLNWSNDATAQAVSGASGAVKIDRNSETNRFLTHRPIPISTSGIWRARFYIDPNSIVWAASLSSEVMVLQASTAAEAGEVSIVQLGKDANNNYVIISLTQLDNNLYNTSGLIIITDAPHWVEVEITKSDGTNNGRHRLWIDTLNAPVFDSGAVLDNDVKTADVELVFFGVYGGSGYQAPSGSVYLDQLVVYENGNAIGPI